MERKYLEIKFKDRYRDYTENGEELGMIIDLYAHKVIFNEAFEKAVPTTFNIYYKVVDEGVYTLFGDGIDTWKIEDDYIPDFLPNAWGDYLDLHIKGHYITNLNASIETIENEFFEKGHIEVVENA